MYVSLTESYFVFIYSVSYHDMLVCLFSLFFLFERISLDTVHSTPFCPHTIFIQEYHKIYKTKMYLIYDVFFV